MSQNEDFGVFGVVASNAKHEEIQRQSDKTVEATGHPRILSARHRSDSVAQNFCSATPDEFSPPTGSALSFGARDRARSAEWRRPALR